MSSPMLMKIGQFDRRDVCCLYKIVLFVGRSQMLQCKWSQSYYCGVSYSYVCEGSQSFIAKAEILSRRPRRGQFN